MQPAPEQVLSLIVERVRQTLDSVGEGSPYYADPDSGEWITTDDGNWCGGH
jgi:unsaturated chondroitin disaccharide hydrolase